MTANRRVERGSFGIFRLRQFGDQHGADTVRGCHNPPVGRGGTAIAAETARDPQHPAPADPPRCIIDSGRFSDQTGSV